MIDPLQILLGVVMTTLTVLLVVIGIEVFRILRESRKVLVRVNTILDDVEGITTSVVGPISKLSELIQGFHQSIGIVNVVAKLLESRMNKNSK